MPNTAALSVLKSILILQNEASFGMIYNLGIESKG